jgi:hypothetical protein
MNVFPMPECHWGKKIILLGSSAQTAAPPSVQAAGGTGYASRPKDQAGVP